MFNYRVHWHAMNGRRLRVALIGCGQIADAHLQEIRKIRGVQLVAVADSYLDLAQQAAARFGVPGVFEDLDGLLQQARPDVLHITTPPQTHRPIALEALARGVHVYVEKPFTVNAAEADDVIAAAHAHQRLVCVGHDQLFDPAWAECRQLVESGILGRIVHVETIQSYDRWGPFGRLTSEPDHWVHRLPGGFFHNTISHGIYEIADFLPDPQPRIWATWFRSLPPAGFPT